MGKVMRASEAGSASYVLALLPATSELWATFSLAVPAATLALWTDTPPILAYLSSVTGVGFPPGVLMGVSGDPLWELAARNGSPDDQVGADAPATDVWITVEMHYVNGGTCELYVNGTLEVTSTTGAPMGDAVQLLLGERMSAPSSPSIVYFDDVKVGTTRGGSDLFSDDFESGDLSHWDDTSGDVSVVDDPFGPTGPFGVSVAFGDPALEPNPTWIRIDDPAGSFGSLVTGWTIDRGRVNERDQIGVGTATINFRDTDGILDPTNPTGPFYGTIDPMRQVCINLQNPVTLGWEMLYRGFVADWSYDVDVSETVITGSIECTDALDLLGAVEMVPGHFGGALPAGSAGDIYYPADQQVDDRIIQALSDAGWPVALQTIFSGNVALQGTVYARRDALITVIQDAADAEFPGGVATLYVAKDGIVTFHGRFPRFNPADVEYGIQTWLVADQLGLVDATIAPVSGIKFRRSKEDIVNAVLALPQNVDETDVPGQLVKDNASIGAYGWRSLSFDSLLVLHGDELAPLSAVTEVKLYATYHVSNYKDPATRIEQIRFRPRPDGDTQAGALWALMCGIELNDIVTPDTRHPGGGGFAEDYFVEGVHYDATIDGGGTVTDVTLDVDVSPRAYFDSNPFS